MRLYPSSQMGRRRRIYADDRDRAGGSPLARTATAERADDVAPVAGEVLRLQRSGGNSAVESLLARAESPLARDDDDQTKAVTTTLILPEPVNVLPVESYSLGRDRKSVQVMVPSTGSDAVLFRWMAQGKPLGTVTLSSQRVTLTIEDALITDCDVSGRVRVTLNGSSITFK